MKILYLCADHGVPVWGRKGCSTHVREFCRALQKAGHETAILCSKAGDPSDAEHDFRVHEIPPSRRKIYGYDLRNFKHNYPFFRAALHLAKAEKFDAVYERFSLYSLVGDWLGARLKIPRVLEVNAFLSREHREKLHFPWLAERCENHVLRNAPAVTAVSEPLRDEIIARGAAPARVAILPTAVDAELFRPDAARRAAARARWNLDNKFVIGYVGGLAAWHGISMLRDMAKILRESRADFVFFVVGGEERHVREHRERAASEGLADHMLFTGAIPYQEVPACVNAMDAALVPDTLPWTCPTKLFEYLASEVPAVAPDYPGVLRVMTHGEEGLVFEKQNAREAADRLLSLMPQPALGQAMGAKGRQRVLAKHSWSCNVQAVIEMLQKQTPGL